MISPFTGQVRDLPPSPLFIAELGAQYTQGPPEVRPAWVWLVG